MGLDMFARKSAEKPSAPVDFKVTDHTELHYWRKHPNLHGWMEQLYYDKGGTAQSFNCVSVQLTSDDLDNLDSALRDGRLPHTEGFFFGDSDGTELDDDLAFVDKARKAISDGLTVFYSSWW